MTDNFENTKWYSYTSSTQTMKTWARYIDSHSVPEKFARAFSRLDAPLRLAIYIPGYKLLWRQGQLETLICLYPDRFAVLQSVGQKVKTISTPFADVLCLEHGKILLQSWIKITLPTGMLAFQFNTVNLPLFTPLIKKIRHSWDALSCKFTDKISVSQPESSSLDDLVGFNYKFMNYGKNAIRQDDSLVAFAYQPERCLQEVKLLSKTILERYSRPHLTLLTEKELILIKESSPIKHDKKMMYGGVFTYIPRQTLGKITFDRDIEKCLTTMKIAFTSRTITSTFSANNSALKSLRKALGRASDCC
jgi:hypothetical protein